MYDGFGMYDHLDLFTRSAEEPAHHVRIVDVLVKQPAAALFPLADPVLIGAVFHMILHAAPVEEGEFRLAVLLRVQAASEEPFACEYKLVD